MRNKILTFLFISYLIIMLFMNILIADKDISYNERRTLTKFPNFNISSILDGSFFDKFDKYTTDQFVKRDDYRTIKANISYNFLRNYDNNGVYVINDHIFKQEYPYNEDGLEKTLNKINNVYNKYLINNNVYYAVIPDKNYFVSDKYLKIDYDLMFKEIDKSFIRFNKIDLVNNLSLDDYYLTDPHLKQECLDEVIKSLVEGMNLEYQNIHYKENVLENFYGSYYGQLALNSKSDNMVYLTNEILDNVSVNYLENPNLKTIYNISKYKGMDPYDIYLDGASSLIEITNNNIESNHELIIFRDSFGSSIAPLLVPYYKKITLVDIRYINSSLLNNYVDFNGKDILFLYSTLIYNTNILK